MHLSPPSTPSAIPTAAVDFFLITFFLGLSTIFSSASIFPTEYTSYCTYSLSFSFPRRAVTFLPPSSCLPQSENISTLPSFPPQILRKNSLLLAFPPDSQLESHEYGGLQSALTDERREKAIALLENVSEKIEGLKMKGKRGKPLVFPFRPNPFFIEKKAEEKAEDDLKKISNKLKLIRGYLKNLPISKRLDLETQDFSIPLLVGPETATLIVEALGSLKIPINLAWRKALYRLYRMSFPHLSGSQAIRYVYSMVSLGIKSESLMAKAGGIIRKAITADSVCAAELVRMLYAFSAADYIDPPLLSLAVNKLINEVDKLSVYQRVCLVRALAELEYDDEKNPIFENVYNSLLPEIDVLLNTKFQILSLVRSMQISGYSSTLLLVSISNYLLDHTEEFTLDELATAVRAFCVLKYYPRDLLLKVFQLDWEGELSLNKPSAAVNEPYKLYGKSQLPQSVEITLSKLYQTYLGFKIESSEDFKLLPSSMDGFFLRLKKIFLDSTIVWGFPSSSLHREVAEILLNDLKLRCSTEHLIDEGLLLDVVVFSNEIEGEKVATDDLRVKFAIEVDGPFHYYQKCFQKFPPRHTTAARFKRRLLEKLGWKVATIPYWEVAPWFKLQKKMANIWRCLPSEIQKLTNMTIDADNGEIKTKKRGEF